MAVGWSVVRVICVSIMRQMLRFGMDSPAFPDRRSPRSALDHSALNEPLISAKGTARARPANVPCSAISFAA